VGKKPTGTLVLEGLRPGKRLYLVGTGTGLAPWLSLVRDPEVYARFDEVIVTHTVREVRDLSYRDFFESHLASDAKVAGLAAAKLRYHPTVTREDFKYQGRITDLIASGKLFDDLGVPPLDPKVDRLMLCGSPGLLADLKTMLTERGYDEGAVATPGDYVLEKAFVT
jgi:ferredoxin--NADP+ reductase